MRQQQQTQKKQQKKRRAGDQGQATTRVRQTLNVPALRKWMTEQPSLRPFFPSEGQETELVVRQFGFGQSNPTYKLDVVSRPSSFSQEPSVRSMVLRKKPVKVVHASAHALHREFRVLQALYRHNESTTKDRHVPVPQVYAYCQDTSVVGQEFYVMEFVEGRIFTDPSLPGMTVTERRQAYRSVLQTLANLHAVDIHSVGLGDYGKPGNYAARQIQRLLMVSARQTELSGTPFPELQAIADQLSAAAPHCPNYRSLLHGDFKMDNMVFSKTAPTVIGVLDWELSTVGDPLCDVANLSMMYFMPPDQGLGIAGLQGMDLGRLGIPERPDLLRQYTQCNPALSLQQAQEWMGFYLAFLFFKNCVIVQGVAQRAKAGVASSAVADRVASLLPMVVDLTQQILDQYPPPTLASSL